MRKLSDRWTKSDRHGAGRVEGNRRASNRASRCVPYGGEATAMHRAHGVEVRQAGRALKHCPALAHLHERKVQRLRNGGIGQLAPQHGMQAREPGHLIGPRHAGATALGQVGFDFLFLGEPSRDVVLFQAISPTESIISQKIKNYPQRRRARIKFCKQIIAH